MFLASRDAGNTLTYDALRAGITLRSVIAAASEVASYADEALSIVNDEYRPPLDCREGCSYCCCKPGVLTSIPDLLRILDHIRATLDADAVADLRARAARYASLIEGRSFDDPTNDSVPCPLLQGGRCSVYEVRPLTCRGYNSTSVDACRSAHADASVLVPIFSVLKDVTDGATVGAAQRLRDAGLNDALVDLGSALVIALAGDDEFPETLVEDGAALLPAQNSTWVTSLWARVRETARQIGVEIQPTLGD